MPDASQMLDLGPATERLTALLPGVTDAQLLHPTPSTDVTVQRLLHHILGLTGAFAAAAIKAEDERTQTPPSAAAGDLPDQWRQRLPAALTDLAQAWQDPAAWTGTATVGGVTMPADMIGAVALDEIVLHSWDLAMATGQPYEPSEADTQVVYGFTAQMCLPEHLGDREGLFGPQIQLPDDAPVFHHALGQSGRDPGWTPPSR